MALPVSRNWLCFAEACRQAMGCEPERWWGGFGRAVLWVRVGCLSHCSQLPLVSFGLLVPRSRLGQDTFCPLMLMCGGW